MGCCEHGNEQLGLRNEGNYLTSWRNVSVLRKTPRSQLLTAETSSLLWTATIQSVAPTPHSVHCTLSVGIVKGSCTVYFVLCSVSSFSSSNTVAVNSAAVKVNWRNLRFLCAVWRHSCVTLCCWWLPLYKCSWIFIRRYTYIRYKQCYCGCNQPHIECNLLEQ